MDEYLFLYTMRALGQSLSYVIAQAVFQNLLLERLRVLGLESARILIAGVTGGKSIFPDDSEQAALFFDAYQKSVQNVFYVCVAFGGIGGIIGLVFILKKAFGRGLDPIMD